MFYYCDFTWVKFVFLCYVNDWPVIFFSFFLIFLSDSGQFSSIQILWMYDDEVWNFR